MKQYPQIKVCGMTRLNQVAELAEMGVNYAGFIFYEKSPRYAAGKIEAPALKKLDTIKKVGVFVNAGKDSILQTVMDYGLDYVQLHGDEAPAFCKEISDSVKVIKVFRVNGDENISELINPFTGTADRFLFDTKAKLYGGTGHKFDWDNLRETVIGNTFFLSGGIGPADAGAIARFASGQQDFVLDLNSRFESAPGIKDTALFSRFLHQLRSSFAGS